MITRDQVSKRIAETGIIPSIRLNSPDDALFAAREILAAGIPIIEVTMTVPHGAEIIAQLAADDPQLIVGAGTVLDLESARRCVDAGAKFLTSPAFDSKLVEFAHAHNIAIFPGALTPSEILAAWNAGADFVKIFPCSDLGGPRYIRDLRGPFPHVPLIASGGVNQENSSDYFLAGVKAIGVGAALIPHEAVELRQPHRIHELARRFLHSAADGRARLARHS